MIVELKSTAGHLPFATLFPMQYNTPNKMVFDTVQADKDTRLCTV